MKFVLAISLIFSSLSLASRSYADGPMTIEQLPDASKAAIAAFKDAVNETLYKSLYAFQVKKNKNDARVKIFYKDGDKEMTQEFFCHEHKHEDGKSEIDCHDL